MQVAAQHHCFAAPPVQQPEQPLPLLGIPVPLSRVHDDPAADRAQAAPDRAGGRQQVDRRHHHLAGQQRPPALATLRVQLALQPGPLLRAEERPVTAPHPDHGPPAGDGLLPSHQTGVEQHEVGQ